MAVSILSRLLSRELLHGQAVGLRCPERFNPLPVIKPGVTALGCTRIWLIQMVSILSRLLSRELPGDLVYCDPPYEGFNPLPVIKPGVTRGYKYQHVVHAVSILSRLLSRELRVIEAVGVPAVAVSILSRLLSRELLDVWYDNTGD